MHSIHISLLNTQGKVALAAAVEVTCYFGTKNQMNVMHKNMQFWKVKKLFPLETNSQEWNGEL